MWIADFLFNALLSVIDWIAFRKFKKTPQFTVPILYGLAALFLALLIPLFSGLRVFATMRFLGMAIFWHVPLLLFCLKRRLPAIVGILLLFLYIYAYHIEPHQLEITRYEFSNAALQGLEQPVLIAQVSDLQTDHVGEFERKVLERLSELHPDLIVYTGDYLHCWNSSEYEKEARVLNSMIQEANLNPRFGSYAVKGDADEPEVWKKVFDGTTVRILEDETVIVPLHGTSISITGLNRDTSRSTNLSELQKAMTGSRHRSLRVFVGHSPDYIRALEFLDQPFLAFAGHTHGGQVQIPWIGPIFTLTHLPSRYADYYGPYGMGVLSVSRGIGMERRDAPRLRFLCKPELRLMTLNAQEQD